MSRRPAVFSLFGSRVWRPPEEHSEGLTIFIMPGSGRGALRSVLVRWTSGPKAVNRYEPVRRRRWMRLKHWGLAVVRVCHACRRIGLIAHSGGAAARCARRCGLQVHFRFVGSRTGCSTQPLAPSHPWPLRHPVYRFRARR